MYVWGYCCGGIWPFERELPAVSLLGLLFSSGRTFFVYYTVLNDSILDKNFRKSAEPPRAFTAVSTPVKPARCLRTSLASLLDLILCSQCIFMMFVYCSPVTYSLVALQLKLATSIFSFPSSSFFLHTYIISFSCCPPECHSWCLWAPRVSPALLLLSSPLLLNQLHQTGLAWELRYTLLLTGRTI